MKQKKNNLQKLIKVIVYTSLLIIFVNMIKKLDLTIFTVFERFMLSTTYFYITLKLVKQLA